MYSDIVEIREVDATEANMLLQKEWKLLEVKTIKAEKFIETVCTHKGGFTFDAYNEYTPLYDRSEKIVYILGRKASQ